ncbi:S8 family serine peptidase [Streptomyces sp. NPDC056704]|uniref:S8 family serine peptidase n=1 Tax=Streptomyces sp. NPDC056704 TaxID=3345917 RepID=UPI00367EAAC2
MPSAYLVHSDTLPARSGAGPRGSGRVLHLYPNGTAVVEAPDTAAVPGEPVPTSGLRLTAPTADRAAIEAAQRSLQDIADLPAPEDEPDVLAYVEFVAPVDACWLADIRNQGVRVLAYQPDNSYLVRGRRSSLAELAATVRTSEGLRAIKSVTELTSALKKSPRTVAEAGETTVVVLAATSQERSRTIAALRDVPGVDPEAGAGNDVLDAQRIRVRVRVGPQALQALLALPQVLSVESFAAAVPEDEIAGLIVAGQLDAQDRPSGSYSQWLARQQLDGAGAVIGIVDAGVDVGHPAFAGRILDLTGGQKDWHATMVAGHAAGDYRAERDPDGFVYGLGTAPAAKLLSQDRNRDARGVCAETVARADPAVAIQNNSWGRGSADPMDYGSEEALYDLLVRDASDGENNGTALTVCFSSGNAGALGLTRPKSAKNVIVTGNSENYRPDVGGADSDDVRDVYTGWSPSSHGNCGDGRIRPHVVAPGEWTASANFDTAPGQAEYVSPLIVWGGGSSGASPKTAGACALLAQWWRRWHSGTDPSPAMLRALVVNGAEPMTTGGPAPNNVQGWGRLSLRELLDPDVARIALDQHDLLTAPGDSRHWSVRVVDPRRPVKITLAWTDPPGAVGTGTATASPVVNRLALRATDGGRTWRAGADRFRDGFSADDAGLAGVTGLGSEGADNLQCLFLGPGEACTLMVSVTALAIAQDALTGQFDHPRQDFVLVVTNAAVDRTETPTTVVAGVTTAAVADRDPAALTHDEAAWWAAGESSDAPAPQPAPETLRRAAGALEATGNTFDVVAAGAPGLAGSATILLDRLVAQRTAGTVVLGVNTGTAVTSAGVEALRALAGTSDLYLVGEDAALLARVATAVGPHARIRYRIADRQRTLADAFHDAALEAGGLQQLVLGPASVEGASATIRFGIIPSDRTLVVALPAPADEVCVRRPGLAPARLGAGHSAFGMRLGHDGGPALLIVDDAGESPGTWSVRADFAQTSPPGTATAWVRGGAALTVTAPRVAPGRRLLRIGAPPGSLLRQVSLPRSRLGDPLSPVPESDRPFVIRVRPSRLSRLRPDGDKSEEAAAETVDVPALGHVFDLPAVPTVLDVPLDVIGADGDATVFARRTRIDMVAVPDAQPDPVDETPLRVTGRIDEVCYRRGTVVGVRVSDGRYARGLEVGSARLGAAIAAMDRSDPVVLGVRGTELEWVFQPFPATDTLGP